MTLQKPGQRHNQLSYQANWQLVIVRVVNIAVRMNIYLLEIWTIKNYMNYERNV